MRLRGSINSYLNKLTVLLVLLLMLPQAVFSQEIGLLDKGVQNISSSVEIFHDEKNAYSANDLINKLF
ncbi:MAG: hypothetical protein OEX03_13310, partial [Gammaproteobacteria bacterium]|nr:hypothetical protein [Gammaproteobacteria bacterium]